HDLRRARQPHAAPHPRARHHGAQPGRDERKAMKNWIYAAAVLLAAPALAQLPLPTKDEPAKKEAAKKDATKADGAKSQPAEGATIAKVNGVAVPRSRQDLLMQQQGARGMPDNDQTRAMVREELINGEV